MQKRPIIFRSLLIVATPCLYFMMEVVSSELYIQVRGAFAALSRFFLMCVYLCTRNRESAGERGRGRERERQRERGRARAREREREKKHAREEEKKRERQREIERDRQR